MDKDEKWCIRRVRGKRRHNSTIRERNVWRVRREDDLKKGKWENERGGVSGVEYNDRIARGVT